MWGVNLGQDFAGRVMRQGSRLRITLLSLSLLAFRKTPLFLGVAKNKDVVRSSHRLRNDGTLIRFSV